MWYGAVRKFYRDFEEFFCSDGTQRKKKIYAFISEMSVHRPLHSISKAVFLKRKEKARSLEM